MEQKKFPQRIKFFFFQKPIIMNHEIKEIKEDIQILKNTIRKSLDKNNFIKNAIRKSKELISRKSKDKLDPRNSLTLDNDSIFYKYDKFQINSQWSGHLKSGSKIKSTLLFIVTSFDEKEKNVFYGELTYYENQMETCVTEIKGKFLEDGFMKLKETKVKEHKRDSKLKHPLHFELMIINSNIEGSYSFENSKKGKDYSVSLTLVVSEKKDE
jgi:hypothetical protein